MGSREYVVMSLKCDLFTDILNIKRHFVCK